jgi:hypothetical protein
VKLALTTVVGESDTNLEQFCRFHRGAGVDVLVLAAPPHASVSDVLAGHIGDGFVHIVEGGASQTELARIAVSELDADWVVPGTTDEVWWPRGESLKDVLAVIPPRYGVVQALVRTFFDEAEPSAPDSAFAARTIRSSLLGPDGAGGERLHALLRPVYRAGPNITLDPEDWTLHGRRVPLRAWYPIEVFRYPVDGVLERGRLDTGLADGSLVVDTRLRDALASAVASFPVPSIVDDSSYAVECAAVGEVDLVRLDRQIRDLELRIAELEARFLPSVRRTLKRLARRRD